MIDPDRNEKPARSSNRVEISSLSIWQAIGAILITLGLLWVAAQIWSLLWIMIIAAFFTLALLPAVNWLHDRKSWNRGAALGAIYLAGFVLLGGLIALLVPTLGTLADEVGENSTEWVVAASEWAEENLNIDLEVSGSEDALKGISEILSKWSGDVFGTVTGIASAGANFILSLMTMATFTFYFTVGEPRIRQATLRRFRPETQLRLGWTWDQAIKQTGGYFYSRTLLMLINGTGFFVVMVLVGLPASLAAPLGLFAGFMSVFIPVIGTYIGAAVPILVTLASVGFTEALIVLAYTLVYQLIENTWLGPKLSSNTMSLSGGVSFFAALAGGSIAGPLGAFMALPTAALITSFISNFAESYDVVYQSKEGESEDNEDV
jgi:predicted PurR-regulated permease PerM